VDTFEHRIGKLGGKVYTVPKSQPSLNFNFIDAIFGVLTISVANRSFHKM